MSHTHIIFTLMIIGLEMWINLMKKWTMHSLCESRQLTHARLIIIFTDWRLFRFQPRYCAVCCGQRNRLTAFNTSPHITLVLCTVRVVKVAQQESNCCHSFTNYTQACVSGSMPFTVISLVSTHCACISNIAMTWMYSHLQLNYFIYVVPVVPSYHAVTSVVPSYHAVTSVVPSYHAVTSIVPSYHAVTSIVPSYHAVTSVVPSYHAVTSIVPSYHAVTSIVISYHTATSHILL